MSDRPLSHFEQIFEDYVTSLKESNDPIEKKFIGDIQLDVAESDVEKLQESVVKLVDECADKPLRKWLKKFFMPVVEGIEDFNDVISTFVSVQPMPAAIVWGSIRLLLGWATRLSKVFEAIQSELQSLSNQLYRLANCQRIYSTSPYTAPTVQRLIGRSYKSILDFWLRVTKELRYPQVVQLGRALLPHRKISDVIENLTADADALEKVCQVAFQDLVHSTKGDLNDLDAKVREEHVTNAIERAAAAEERRLNELLRASIENEHKQAAQERVKAADEREKAEIARQKLGEEIARAEHERKKAEQARIEQRQIFLTELLASLKAGSGPSAGLYGNMVTGRHQGTCQWLFDSDNFLRWIAEDTKKPVLWLYGKHGAGKSYLCAAAIERICGNPDARIAAYQFVTTAQPLSEAQLLRGLAFHLLDCYVARQGDLPDDIAVLARCCTEDAVTVQRLIHRLLSDLNSMYMFIDGLDEAGPSSAITSVVTFLISEVAQRPRHLRLWLSSQFQSDLEKAIRRRHSEIVSCFELRTQDTYKDIRNFVKFAIPESTTVGSQLAELLFTDTMTFEAEGSFLWAAAMINDLKEASMHGDGIEELVQKGLPMRMSDYYERVIKDYSDRRRYSKAIPLWRIILSLLTFAKRPLRLREIQEAIAVVRSTPGENYGLDKRLSLAVIRNECWQLVRFIQSDDNAEDGTLILYHNAVYQFLFEHSDLPTYSCDKQQQHVSATLLRDCCVNYLCQPRYSKLLEKVNVADKVDCTDFRTYLGESLCDQHLLIYASKYWYRHCNALQPSESIVQKVRNFMLSRNFQTCMQVQSIAIVGQFMISCDATTGYTDCLQNSIPEWAPDLDDEHTKFRPQLHDYLQEWIGLLQLGLTSTYHGEIDRCFWNALGPRNFLHSNEERYKSFEFTPEEGDKETKSSPCCFHGMAADGSSILVVKVAAARDNEDRSLEIRNWTIDGQRRPAAGPSKISKISASPVDFSLYTMPCSRHFCLIPTYNSVVTPEAVCVMPGTLNLRIGPTISALDAIPARVTSANTTSKTADQYWEEFVDELPLVVKCRRRVPEVEKHIDRIREDDRIAKMKHARDRMWGRDESDTDSPSWRNSSSGSDSLHDRQQRHDRREFDASHESTASHSSAEFDSAADISDSGSSLRSPGIASETDEGDFDVASGPEDSESNPSDDDLSSRTSGKSTRSESPDDLRSPLDSEADESNSASLRSLPTSESSILDHESVDDSDGPLAHELHAWQSDKLLKSRETFNYPTSINPGEQNGKICDSCGKSLDIWYHCNKCEKGDYDLCHGCVSEGMWCYSKTHQLYEADRVGPLSVLSWRNFRTRQEIQVFVDGDDTVVPTFSWSAREKTLLHHSPPSLFSRGSLVAWPVARGKLLIANYLQKQEFIVHDLPLSAANAYQVSVSLKFSTCGAYLFVGSVEATRVRLKASKRNQVQGSKQREVRYCLSFHVMILRLSASAPAKHHPRLVNRRSHNLGLWDKPFVSQLPYTWTWLPSAVYFTMSGSELRVYRMLLPRDINCLVSLQDQAMLERCTRATGASSDRDVGPVMTPKETIFLPRSARDRSVQFLPPSTPSASSLLIIGPRYGVEPKPPIGVYFTKKDLGGWIDVKQKEEERKRLAPKRRLNGLFEQFDRDQDCDIIPMDRE